MSDEDGVEFDDYLKEDEAMIERTLLTESGAALPLTILARNTGIVSPVSVDNATGFPYAFSSFKKIPYKGTKTVRFLATCTSQERGQQRYPLEVSFYDVDISRSEMPIVDVNPVRCRCSCSSYYFYFSYWNWVNKCHAGTKPKRYVRKTTNYPERNPQHLPGVCKHLIAFTNFLIDNKEVKGV